MREQYNQSEMVNETEPHVLHTERSIDQLINQSVRIHDSRNMNSMYKVVQIWPGLTGNFGLKLWF